MTQTDPVTVVVADDHPVVRDGLRLLLESLPGIDVVGDASAGDEAVRECVLTRPDVVVMDLRMPGVDGVEAIRQLTVAAPDVAVLVLTMADDQDSILAALRAGAHGYVLKGAPQEEIVRAIRAVAAGDAIFGPGVAGRVLHQFAAHAAVSDPFPALTHREQEVLDLVAAGLRNSAIATRLGLSSKTVANHLSTVFTKLGVAGRGEAIARARDAGLGRTPSP